MLQLERAGHLANPTLAFYLEAYGIAAFNEQAMILSEPGPAPERLRGAFISAHTFGLIGARPALGRDFRAEDDREGATPVVILGHDVWRNRYQSDPMVIGRSIRVNGVAATVIGVMPDGFLFPLRAFAWQPLSALDTATKSDRTATRTTARTAAASAW